MPPNRITHIDYIIGSDIFCRRRHFGSGIFINFLLGNFDQFVIIAGIFLLRLYLEQIPV